ncbi:hypothetical protein Tco_0118634, partial [Tanacetum coccineum]
KACGPHPDQSLKENSRWPHISSLKALTFCWRHIAWTYTHSLGLPGVRIGAFRHPNIYSFDPPFPLHHMSFGSQSVGDAVVPKFNMHINTSVLTFDEVKSLIEEYAAPLDLHPCVPPFGRQAFPRHNPGGDGIGSFLPLINYFVSYIFYC